jgi:CheY-like chemotaxis protein
MVNQAKIITGSAFHRVSVSVCHRFAVSPFRRFVFRAGWGIWRKEDVKSTSRRGPSDISGDIQGESLPTMVIDEAENGEEALRRINETPPHLIFMDMRLPGMNGLQLTQKIKRDFPDIHIAILTGYDSPEYRQAAVQYGADAFLVKESLQWDEIKSLVESLEKTRCDSCEGTTKEG